MEDEQNHEQDVNAELDSKAELLASALHEDWRSTRLLDDGSYEPRVKQTTDQSWIEANGSDQVDIANTGYDALPKDWQQENHDAAYTVVSMIDGLSNSFRDRDSLAELVHDGDSDVYNDIGNTIHSAWLERNTWAKDGDLDVPFENLPSDEKDKDIAQYLIGVNVLFPENPAKPDTWEARFGQDDSAYNEAKATTPKPGRFYRYADHEWSYDPQKALDFLGDSPDQYKELDKKEQKELMKKLKEAVRQTRRETTFRGFYSEDTMPADYNSTGNHNDNLRNLAYVKALRRRAR